MFSVRCLVSDVQFYKCAQLVICLDLSIFFRDIFEVHLLHYIEEIFFCGGGMGQHTYRERKMYPKTGAENPPTEQ